MAAKRFMGASIRPKQVPAGIPSVLRGGPARQQDGVVGSDSGKSMSVVGVCVMVLARPLIIRIPVSKADGSFGRGLEGPDVV